jgi:predicted DsbA family dithiol-disulfide isomerase
LLILFVINCSYLGQEYDIHFQWDGLTDNTLLAHQLVDYTGNPEHGGDLTKQNELMEELFKQVHENRQSPASLPMLLETAENVGLDREKVC